MVAGGSVKLVRWCLAFCAIPIGLLAFTSTPAGAQAGVGVATVDLQGIGPTYGTVTISLNGLLVAGKPFVGSASTTLDYGFQSETGCLIGIPASPSCTIGLSQGPISGNSIFGGISGTCGEPGTSFTELAAGPVADISLVCSISIGGGAPTSTTFTIIGAGLVLTPIVGVYVAS